jgi:hypothetical protein
MKIIRIKEPNIKKIHFKNILHALASISFTIWLIGFFGYQLGGWFFGFLMFAIITGLLLIRGRKKTRAAAGLSSDKKLRF